MVPAFLFALLSGTALAQATDACQVACLVQVTQGNPAVCLDDQASLTCILTNLRPQLYGCLLSKCPAGTADSALKAIEDAAPAIDATQSAGQPTTDAPAPPPTTDTPAPAPTTTPAPATTPPATAPPADTTGLQTISEPQGFDTASTFGPPGGSGAPVTTPTTTSPVPGTSPVGNDTTGTVPTSTPRIKTERSSITLTVTGRCAHNTAPCTAISTLPAYGGVAGGSGSGAAAGAGAAAGTGVQTVDGVVGPLGTPTAVQFIGNNGAADMRADLFKPLVALAAVLVLV